MGTAEPGRSPGTPWDVGVLQAGGSAPCPGSPRIFAPEVLPGEAAGLAEGMPQGTGHRGGGWGGGRGGDTRYGSAPAGGHPNPCEKGWIRVTGQSKSPNSLAGRWRELGVDRLRTLAPVHPKPRPTAFESFPKEIRWLVIESGEALPRFSSASPPSPSGKGGWDAPSAAGSCRGEWGWVGARSGSAPKPHPPRPKARSWPGSGVFWHG